MLTLSVSYRLYAVVSDTRFYADSIYSAGTGAIKIQTPIDYESLPDDDKTITFTVTAEHPTDPSSTTATATVTVTVTGETLWIYL